MDRKIGIKFCGGCNPQFDRRKVFEHIIDSLEKHFAKLSLNADIKCAEENTEYDYLILIGGCGNCCTSYNNSDAKIVFKIRNEEDAINAIEAIEEATNELEKTL